MASKWAWLGEADNAGKPITQADLKAIEAYADKLFAKVGIDIEFTRHFLDRVNDERNRKQITMAELTRLFKQEYKRWAKPIAQMGPDAEAVMKDMRTDINMPFVLKWNKNTQELDLIAKTVMRKKNFKTPDKEFRVEGMNEDADKWVIYNVKTKKQVGTKTWSTMKGAKAALAKADNADHKVASQLHYIDNIREGVMDYIGRKAKVKVTNGRPKVAEAPKWATCIGQTPEGAWHWLSNETEVETSDSDDYFPNAERTEFAGYKSRGTKEGGVWSLPKKSAGTK